MVSLEPLQPHRGHQRHSAYQRVTATQPCLQPHSRLVTSLSVLNQSGVGFLLDGVFPQSTTPNLTGPTT